MVSPYEASFGGIRRENICFMRKADAAQRMEYFNTEYDGEHMPAVISAQIVRERNIRAAVRNISSGVGGNSAMRGLDFTKYGITYETLKNAEYVLAFDLGHGESSVSYVNLGGFKWKH